MSEGEGEEEDDEAIVGGEVDAVRNMRMFKLQQSQQTRLAHGPGSPDAKRLSDAAKAKQPPPSVLAPGTSARLEPASSCHGGCCCCCCSAVSCLAMFGGCCCRCELFGHGGWLLLPLLLL
jgi:hypothetical protein